MPRKGENIYRRRDGRWEGRYKTGYNECGKAKYHSVYGHSYAEVKEKLLTIKTAPAVSVIVCHMTVKELFEEWLFAIKLRVKSSTYANYRMKVEKHIIPEFGGLRYDLLTVPMINRFIGEKIHSGLSEKYVSDIITVFKSMARYTSKIHGFRNIFEDISIPKKPQKELLLLTSFQQQRLCRYLLSNLNATTICVLLSLYTGLRVGEVCGLMWGDIDFERNLLTVKRTVQRISTDSHGTRIIVGTPKSRASLRSIPIPNIIMKLLRDTRSNNNHFILSGSENIIEPRTLQRRFQTVLKKVGLPSINYHCLRHMFATNCLQAGFDVKTLSEILGHSSVGTTLNRYVHSSMERKRACMELIQITA